MADQATAPRDPDAAEKARARFAQALADLDLTVVQRIVIKGAAEDLCSQLIEAHARSPYPPKRRQQEREPA